MASPSGQRTVDDKGGLLGVTWNRRVRNMGSLEKDRSRKVSFEHLESRHVLSAAGGWVDYHPIAEATNHGTKTDRSDAATSNDVYQVLRESNGTARLDHVWGFNIPSAKAVRLVIEAHTDAVDEVFHLAYSTNDGKTYQRILSIDNNSDLDRARTYSFPASTNGEVFIAVRDSNRNEPVSNRVFVDRVTLQVNFQEQDPPSETEPELRAPFKILTMGDSVSSGITSADAKRRGIPARDGYLPAFWDALQSRFGTSPPVEFIGTTTYNSDSLPTDSAHSLYRGFASYSFFPHRLPKVGSNPDGAINSNLTDADGWGTLRPDAVLLLLGTNDVTEGRRIASLETTLRQIITELRAGNSNVEILLGTLLPIGSQFPNADRILQANTMIRNLVHAEGSWKGSTTSSPIHIVDHHRGQSGPAFSLSLHADNGIHPNKAGERLIAMNWLSVLEPILKGHVNPPGPDPNLRAPGPNLPAPIPILPAPEARPRVTVASIQDSVAESSASTAQFVVSRDGDISDDLDIRYRLIGSASPGSDFVQPSGRVTIKAGTRDELIEIDLLSDNRDEPNESLGIWLRDSSSYTIRSSPIAILTISDQRPSSPWPTVSVSRLDSTVTESDSSTIQFLVSRKGNISEDLVIRYLTTGSASAGTDYVQPSGKVTIHAGTRDELIEIDVLSDNLDEPNETVGVRLLSGSNYVLSSAFKAAVVLVDND